MRLKLLTLNVWSGLSYQGLLRVGSWEPPGGFEARYRLLVRQLQELAPDVLALNEVNPVPAYPRRLARDLGYTQVAYPGLSGLRLGPLALPVNLVEGDALLARPDLDLRWEGRAQLSGGPVARHWSVNFGNATQVIGASLRTPGGRLYLLNTHWSVCLSARDYQDQQGYRESAEASPQARRAHARAADRRWQESTRTLAAARRWIPTGAPAVLMGDLNAPPNTPEIDLWQREGWTDAFAALHPGEVGATWDEATNPHIRSKDSRAPAVPAWAGARAAERLDYILVSGPVTLESAAVVLDRPPHPSDHYGVLVTLTL